MMKPGSYEADSSLVYNCLSLVLAKQYSVEDLGLLLLVVSQLAEKQFLQSRDLFFGFLE